MNATQSLADLFRIDRDSKGAGVLGLVDDLLAYCRDRDVRLTWNAAQVSVQPIGGGAVEQASVEFRSSAFRAVLARLAALCNRHRLDSVSPYGGQGEFIDERAPATAFRVDFRNTPDEQRLELIPTHAGRREDFEKYLAAVPNAAPAENDRIDATLPGSE
jgi:hypothetical protein